MKTLAAVALLLLLSTPTAAKDGISISLNSDDSRAELGPRHDVRDARMAITTKDRSVVLLLVDDVVAMQLSDVTLNRIEDESEKKETNFFEELVLAGVQLALGKSVEYPIASIKTFDYKDGALRVIGTDNKPIFTEVKVNGTNVLRGFSPADVARFANALRATKSR